MHYLRVSPPSGPRSPGGRSAPCGIFEYFNIDEAVVEDVIANDLDPLNVAVNALLDTADDA